jgi:beta-lactamase regulating signal transducer with metallopeptidase domain
MIEFIDGVLEPALWFLADWSLRWALLVVVLATWLFLIRPRRSATRYLLCLLVFLAGFVLPALPRWGTGFTLPAGKPIPTPASAAADNPRRAPSGDPVSQTAPQEEFGGLSQASVDREFHQAPAESTEAKPTADALGLRRIGVVCLAIAWILGVSIQLLRRAGGWLILKRMRRNAVPVQGASLGVFQTCRAQLALRRQVTLAAHSSIRSPVTLGLHRPMILVPPSWTELPEQARRGSLLHELAHLARYDDWLALVLEFVRVVFFFHPFLHWLIGRIEYERELLCDEAALAQGIDPRDYAGLLLEFSRQAGRLRPALVCRSHPLGFGHRRTVKTRINRLLEGNMKRWMSPLPVGRAIALGAVALGLALLLGSFGARALELDGKDSPTIEFAPAVPQQANKSPKVGVPAVPHANIPETKVSSKPQEPTPPVQRKSFLYGGKSLDQWQAILMTDLKPETRIEAIKALSAFGANGYGKEAAAAIIELMRTYDTPSHDQEDQKVVAAAYAAFKKLGPEGVSALIQELKQGTVNGRQFAIAALQIVGPTVTRPSRPGYPPTVVHVFPKAAAPAALDSFKDENSYVRRGAISSINTRDVDPKRLLAALTEAMKDPDANVRFSAINKLGQMGKSAKPAVPALLAALKDDNENVRLGALFALLKTGPKLSEALPGILMGLKEQKTIHQPIYEYLEALGPEAKEAVPALMEAFNTYPGERAEIAGVLGNIGPAAKEALPTLIEFIQQEKAKGRYTGGVRDAVEQALRKITK